MNNASLLLDQSQVESGEKILIGDSIFYNRDTGMGEVYGNMSLIDTAQHVTLQGEYGYYNEQTGYAFATDSARFLEYSQGDTLFLHADTLQMVTVDSVYREIKAITAYVSIGSICKAYVTPCSSIRAILYYICIRNRFSGMNNINCMAIRSLFI